MEAVTSVQRSLNRRIPQPGGIMADYNDSHHQVVSFPDQTVAIQRYLPSELAETLLHADCPPRARLEAFIQLVSARYAISTYLPRHLVAHQVAVDADGPWLEWVDGSLLFADVSGSTALAERLTILGREGIEIVTRTLNDFFDTMIAVIQADGGDLLTFGGDALLVFFGGPDHAYVATRAARALLERLAGFERTVPGIGAFPLNMRIGVESGRVALASAGQPGSLRYSALGSIVNSVARAEGYGSQGELIVGPQTWARISADAEGVEREAGYVLVHGLRSRPAAPSPLPRDEPITVAPDQAIPLLVRQLDRISPYLPAGLLARILADPQRPRIEADLRPVTVLFAQVLGLGPLVETLTPDQAARLLDAFLRPMQDAVERFGGVINKLDLADEGDKLLAIFGAPVAYEDHAERAARAALAMQAALADIACADQGVALELRIGLNTGPVFAGNVGTAERKEYTVMGDAVNVAARVMARAAWGEVWCSAATATAISARLVCVDRGAATVKGKSEPLNLLRIVGERDMQPARELFDTPLVGRQAELAWLRERLTAARAGQGRVARVNGEAGVGKSRLCVELLAQARAEGVRVLHVCCLSYASNTPYAPWSDWLKELCGIVSGDDQAARAAKLGATLSALGGDALEWLPLLADLVRLDVEETVLTRALDPQQRQTRRFELIADLLRTAARAAPAGLLALFEDLHWADPASLDLWQYVAARVGDLPVLLLGLHRPQFAWEERAPDEADLLELSELSPADSEALLDTRLHGGDLPLALRRQIVARAAGNPLFLEELLHAVLSSNGDADTVVAALDELPDSLNGLLLARIDRLDENSRALLRVASVIGQRFPFGVLQSIHPADQRALLRLLGHLDNQALTLLEREAPERVHTFRHALMQEVVYQSLLYSRRRELHRRIGEYLERRYADDMAALRTRYTPARAGYDLFRDQRDPLPPERPAQANTSVLFLLAHHYRLSDQPEKAITYLLLAGHAARAAYANDEAIQYYRWTLELLHDHPADPRTWEARESLGDVLCTIGDYAAALTEHAAILASDDPAAGAPLPPAVAAEAHRSRGYALEKQGQYAPALEELIRAERVAQARLDAVPPLLIAAVCADMSLVLMRRGEYDQALEVGASGLSKVRPDRRSREDERIAARLHTQIGTIHGMRGDYVQARFHFENALAIQDQIDNFYGSSVLHNNIGYLWQLQSDYEQALEHYTLAEEMARRISAKYVLSSAYLNAAYAAYCLGQYARAETGCQAALQLCQEMDEQDGIAQVYDLLGMVAYSRGDYSAARVAYDQALAIQRAIGGSYQEGSTLANIANVDSAEGRVQAAIATAEQALAIGEQIQSPNLTVEALLALAEAGLMEALPVGLDSMQREALLERSAEQARRAATMAEDLGSRRDYGSARRLLGQLAAQRGQPYDEDFQASIAVFTAIKNPFELARAQARYAEALVGRNLAAAIAYQKQARETFNQIGARGELARLGTLHERSI